MILKISEIFNSFSNVLEGHTGKRRATIIKENDGKKNIYNVHFETYNMTPEKESREIFYTKRRALDYAIAFLDTEDPNFYWSETILDFNSRYFN